jgi:ketosteroid isomerase-like protein
LIDIHRACILDSVHRLGGRAHLITGARSSKHKTGDWVRGTTCFERRDGEWLVTHEHISLPAS